MPRRYAALFLLLITLSAAADSAQVCVIQSNDELPDIMMCQENINIPSRLFEDAFCRPQIPDREFDITLAEHCPTGAYGICKGAKSAGVAYQQSIHYYSDPDDAAVLSAYCEQISGGEWIAPESSE
jgi:hypothetical protein